MFYQIKSLLKNQFYPHKDSLVRYGMAWHPKTLWNTGNGFISNALIREGIIRNFRLKWRLVFWMQRHYDLCFLWTNMWGSVSSRNSYVCKTNNQIEWDFESYIIGITSAVFTPYIIHTNHIQYNAWKHTFANFHSVSNLASNMTIVAHKRQKPNIQSIIIYWYLKVRNVWPLIVRLW